MPFFENQGAKLYYEEIGQGTPLVFLHGATWDMRQWDRQIDIFSSKYHVITLDARGHGKSSLPEGKVPPNIFWQDVVAMLDFLSVPKAVICGLSMGGHVAIQTAINAKERVSGLILIGTPFTNQFNTYERVVVPINRFSQRLMPMSWIAWISAEAFSNSNPKQKEYIYNVINGINHDVYNRVWKAITSMDSREGLGKINCPTLILIGDNDKLTGRQQQYLNENIKGSRIEVIKKASHSTIFDNPEQIEKEIGIFMESF
jgi:Predicted hydrolases or acyltransferases (alpha/beta hydrolase superfamily)